MSEPTPKYPPWKPEYDEIFKNDALDHHGVVTSVYDAPRGLLGVESPSIAPTTYQYDRPSVCPISPNGNGHANGNGNGRRRRRPKPHWDADNLLLTFCGVLSKRVEPHAHRQIALLNRFQWVGWEALIKKPIPDEDGMVYAEILHEAVRGLNHSHVRQLIEVHQDGTGKGARWNLTAAGATLLETAERELPAS